MRDEDNGFGIYPNQSGDIQRDGFSPLDALVYRHSRGRRYVDGEVLGERRGGRRSRQPVSGKSDDGAF